MMWEKILRGFAGRLVWWWIFYHIGKGDTAILRGAQGFFSKEHNENMQKLITKGSAGEGMTP
jgi:hypothetical protein